MGARFFQEDVWTAFGTATYAVLFFMCVGTWRVKIGGVTVHPNSPRVELQACNLVCELAERGEKASFIKDDDKKLTTPFKEVLRGEDTKVKTFPPSSPNLNAFAERFVQSIKNGGVDWFVISSERHLKYLIRKYED